MSGIKNIKKKLKGFQVRPPNAEVIKKVLLHIPYVVVFYVVNKCTWLYQYCRGSTVVDRLMVLFMNYPLAFKKLLPSIQPKSLAAGTIAAVSVWAVVYFKGKNGKKFRQGEEYGSARWGNEKDIAPFIDPVFENNILLTQTERLTMNSRPKKPKYARNKNVIVIGGSGSGKTRFYVKPQLMQMPDNVSFVVTDPKGTIIVECGKMLARGTPKKDKNGKILRDKNGRVVMAPYKIKVLNTINFAKSMHYNPFHYIRSEKDILKLVNTIMVNTKGEGEKSSEDFWTKAERLLYCALIGYIYYEAPEEEQNFSTLLEFINASETREEDEEFKNAAEGGKVGYIIPLKNVDVVTPKLGMDILFPDSQANGGFWIACLIAVLMWVIMTKTTFGFELRACGLNRHAARYAGINDKRNIVLSMVIAGALASAGGCLYFLSGNTEFYWSTYMSLPADGFNGIPVALLASNHPIGVIFAGLFMSMLNIAGLQLKYLTAYNEYIANIIIATIVYLSAFAMFFKMLLNTKRKKAKEVQTAVTTEEAKPEIESAETDEAAAEAEDAVDAEEEGGQQ